MDPEPTEELKLLGLTDYEARTFVALHTIEEGSASQIARVSRVPRSSVYEVLRSLEQKGAVISEQGKPLRYRLASLDSALESLEGYRKKEIAKMGKDLVNARRKIIEGLAATEVLTHIEEESFWTIRGDERIKAKMIEVIKGAKRDLKVGGSEDLLGLIEELKMAQKRGVNVDVLVSPEVGGDLGLSNVFVARSKELHHELHYNMDSEMAMASGILLVADGKECVVSTRVWDVEKEPLREKTCLWARSEGLARIFTLFFNVLVKVMGRAQ